MNVIIGFCHYESRDAQSTLISQHTSSRIVRIHLYTFTSCPNTQCDRYSLTRVLVFIYYSSCCDRTIKCMFKGDQRAV